MASLKAIAKEAKSKKKPSAPKQESKKAPEPVYKSAEFIADSDQDDKTSDDESESDEEAPARPNTVPIPATNGKFVATDESSSESASGSSSDSEESSSSEEEEGEDEEMADADGAPVVERESVKKPFKEPAGTTVSFKTAPYKPPTGFEQGKCEGTSKASQMFKKSNLEGKQIWYFTAPAAVPVSSIESMSLLDAKNGKPVLEYNGGDYAFLQDSAEDKTYTKIMVPNSSDEGYRTASRSIDQVFHLQQIVKLAGIVDDAPTSNHSCGRVKKPARPQPKGLKMRFRPLGFGNGDLGNIGSSSSSEADDDDDEMNDAPALRESSKSVSKTKSEKHSSDNSSLKRKHTESDGKKSKTSSSGTATIPDNKKLKRLKKNKTESQINTADSPSASTNHLESSVHNRQRETAIPLPEPPKSSQLSESHQSQFFQKHLKKKDRKSSPKTDAKSDISLEKAPKKKDLGFTSEEPRRKIKKMKKARCEEDDGSS